MPSLGLVCGQALGWQPMRFRSSAKRCPRTLSARGDGRLPIAPQASFLAARFARVTSTSPTLGQFKTRSMCRHATRSLGRRSRRARRRTHCSGGMRSRERFVQSELFHVHTLVGARIAQVSILLAPSPLLNGPWPGFQRSGRLICWRVFANGEGAAGRFRLQCRPLAASPTAEKISHSLLPKWWNLHGTSRARLTRSAASHRSHLFGNGRSSPDPHEHQSRRP